MNSFKNYFLKKTKRTPTMAQNCPNINMNIHFIISDFTSDNLFSNLSVARSNIDSSDLSPILLSNSISASAPSSLNFSLKILGKVITFVFLFLLKNIILLDEKIVKLKKAHWQKVPKYQERQSLSKGRSRKYNCSLECPAVECSMSSAITPFSRNHLSLKDIFGDYLKSTFLCWVHFCSRHKRATSRSVRRKATPNIKISGTLFDTKPLKKVNGG